MRILNACGMFFLVAFMGCQKNLNNKSSVTNIEGTANKFLPVSKCDSNWEGSYIIPGSSSVYFGPGVIINNGIAQIPPEIVPSSYYFTSLGLTIPSCESIDGDNLKFEATLENPDSIPKANTDYDVSIFINGSQDSAHVTFIAYRAEYTSLQVGSYGVTGSNALLHLFEGWTKVSLVTKNNHLSVSLNNTLVQKISYNGTKIGEVKSISFGFKGSGKVDQMKLINSATNVLYLNENFVKKEADFK